MSVARTNRRRRIQLRQTAKSRKMASSSKRRSDDAKYSFGKKK